MVVHVVDIVTVVAVVNVVAVVGVVDVRRRFIVVEAEGEETKNDASSATVRSCVDKLRRQVKKRSNSRLICLTSDQNTFCVFFFFCST